MKDALKKEIIKWLYAEIIDPILDGVWVSPIQCIPKNGGMPMIKNETN